MAKTTVRFSASGYGNETRKFGSADEARRHVERDAAVIYPIIASGDVMGAVVMLTGDTAKIPTNVETKLAQSAAAFLGKQMEE